jgi:hypothetical protein
MNRYVCSYLEDVCSYLEDRVFLFRRFFRSHCFVVQSGTSKPIFFLDRYVCSYLEDVFLHIVLLFKVGLVNLF